MVSPFWYNLNKMWPRWSYKWTSLLLQAFLHTNWIRNFSLANIVVRRSNFWKNCVMKQWVSATLCWSADSTCLMISSNHSYCFWLPVTQMKYNWIEIKEFFYDTIRLIWLWYWNKIFIQKKMNSRLPRWCLTICYKKKIKYTFLHLILNMFLMDDMKTKSFRIDAYGVTPIPPPTSTETSYLYQSCCPAP